MTKSIIPAIKKSLDFLDNTKIRLVIVILLVIYSAFISIQYNYSTIFNKPLIRLFFLLIIVIVSMKDITIGLLLAIAMLISINYKPVSTTYEAMTLNCTPVDSESGSSFTNNTPMDSESNEGFDSEEVEGFNTPNTPTPLPANVPAKTTPSPVSQTPAPANNTVKSSQPANVATSTSMGAQLPTQTATQKSTPTPTMPAAPTMTTNGNVVQPTLAPKVAMPLPVSGGNSTTTSLTKKITEMFSTKNKQMKNTKHTARATHASNVKKMTKEHFSINGFMSDDDETPAEYNSSTNCLQVLQGTSGNNLNLSSQCGSVATFENELNAQGMIELPMGYHSMGNWGSF
jgi:hypothetical protein